MDAISNPISDLGSEILMKVDFLGVAIIITFGIMPIFFLCLIANDSIRSKRLGTDCDIIASGINKLLKYANEGDIVNFDASFYRWYQDASVKLKSKFGKISSRYLLEAKLIGFNEGNREKLENNIDYQKKAITHTEKIKLAYERGDLQQVINQIGNLFSLFQCKSANGLELFDSMNFASSRLLQAFKLLRSGYPEAYELISTSIVEIENKGNPVVSGIPLLALHWAKYRLRYKRNRSSIQNLLFETLTIQRQLGKMAKYIKQNNLRGILNVLSIG